MARRFTGAHDGAVTALCFHADTLYSSGTDGRVIEWGTDAHRVIHEGEPMLALAWWNDALWGLERGRLRGLQNTSSSVAMEDAHLLMVHAQRLVAVGDGVAIAFRPGLEEDARWPLPAGHTADATIDGTRLLCVKDVDVHVVTLKTGVSKQWRRKQKAGRAFVRNDARGRTWLVERGTYSIAMVNPDSGKSGRTQPRRPINGAHAGPCEIAASAGYLAIVHVGRDVEVWDVERDVSMFYVTVDPQVSEQEALQGLHRVPRFTPLGDSFIRQGSTPSPGFAQDVQCVAVSERAVALGHSDGGIVLIDMITAAMSALARDRTEVLEPLRTKKLFQLGALQATARDGYRLFTLSGGRLRTFEAASGEQIGDVALEGPEHDLVYELAVSGDAVWASVSGGLYAWGIDGRLRARVEARAWSLLSARSAYFIDSASRPRHGVPIQWRDLMTGEQTVSTFEPPAGMAIDHGSGGLRLFGLGDRCVAELSVEGGGKHRWFYDVERNELGAPMPFRVELAVVDATGKVIAAPTDHGWVLLQGSEVLAGPDNLAGRQGLLRLCDHDVSSGRVAGNDGRHHRLNVWERDGTLVAQLPGYTFVSAAVFAEGGRHLLTVSQAGVVRWWDLQQ